MSSRTLENLEFKDSYEDSCAKCSSRSSSVWIGSDENFYCSECVFGIYVVEYERYLENVVNARVKSREQARQKGTSEELLGHCARNAATLLSELEADSRVPNEMVHLCVGSATHESVGETRHYWVCIGSGERNIHVDSEVYKQDGGVWINNQIPDNYSINRKIPLDQEYSFPDKVKKWYRKRN